MEYKEFGKKLKELRVAKGESQEGLADRLKVGIKQIQRYEAGSVLPTHENLNLLIQHYQYDFLSLIYTQPSGVAKPAARESTDYKEKYIAEKEARRQEAEARLNDVKKDNDRLFSLLENGFVKLLSTQDLLLAHEKAWFDYHAQEVAAGDPAKEKAVKAKLSRLVGERQLGPVPKGKKQAPGK